jgi:tetratricopeptide (TPR) repeat protein
MRAREKRKAAVKGITAVPAVFLLAVLLLTSCATTGNETELARLNFELGNAYMELEQWQKARTAYEAALEATPDMRKAAYNLSRALIRLGEYDAAEKRLLQLLEQDPENGILLETLAWVYIKQGHTTRAAETYRRALERRPQDASVLFNLALLARQREEPERAYDYLITVVEAEKADAAVYYRLGQVSSVLENGEAPGWYSMASEEQPETPRYREALAEAYAEHGSYEKAAEEYRELARLAGVAEDERAEYLYRRARVLLTGAEDYAAGTKALRSALEAGFDDQTALADLLSYPDLLDPGPIEELLEERGLLEKVKDEMERERSQEDQPGEEAAPEREDGESPGEDEEDPDEENPDETGMKIPAEAQPGESAAEPGGS